jgi:hypothetical protein
METYINIWNGGTSPDVKKSNYKNQLFKNKNLPSLLNINSKQYEMSPSK